MSNIIFAVGAITCWMLVYKFFSTDFGGSILLFILLASLILGSSFGFYYSIKERQFLGAASIMIFLVMFLYTFKICFF